MKRFKFALEKVLELRKYGEQEAKIELGRAIGILTEIENNIKRNAAMRIQAAAERFSGINANEDGNAAGGNDGVLSMHAWENYILRLEQEGEVLAEQAAEAEQVVEEKRNLYLEANRELKVMEKLKEKRHKEYREEALAAETRERDDTWRNSESRK
jgi:flagellar FliJ protein